MLERIKAGSFSSKFCFLTLLLPPAVAAAFAVGFEREGPATALVGPKGAIVFFLVREVAVGTAAVEADGIKEEEAGVGSA